MQCETIGVSLSSLTESSHLPLYPDFPVPIMSHETKRTTKSLRFGVPQLTNELTHVHPDIVQGWRLPCGRVIK
jgi:hypothetical protein